MNGNGKLTETENVIFLRKLWNSYGILTDKRNSRIFETEHGDTVTDERKRNAGNQA